MAWKHPTPQESLSRIQAQMDIDLPKADSRIRWSVENVIGKVLVLACRELYGYIQYISRQILVSTADEEHLPRHGSEWGIPRKGMTKANGPVLSTGTNGSVVEAGRVLRRGDNVEYTLDADVTIAGGTGLGAVTAVKAGTDGAATAGTKINLTSPVPGVSSESTVQAPGLTGGNDIESPDEWRARIIERKQRPPQGGDADDYVTWTKEVPGVTRAWVYPKQAGLGTVSVAFVMDHKDGGIIPSPADVADVQLHLNKVRPVTAEPIAFAPTAAPVNFTIHLSPNTVAIQEAVKAELKDFIEREAQPGGTLYLSRIREAVSAAAGEFDNIVIAPAANIESGFGDLPVVGAFTFGGI